MTYSQILDIFPFDLLDIFTYMEKGERVIFLSMFTFMIKRIQVLTLFLSEKLNIFFGCRGGGVALPSPPSLPPSINLIGKSSIMNICANFAKQSAPLVIGLVFIELFAFTL